MVAKTTEVNFDPLARAIPGQSLTDEPKKNPYEHPSSIVSPEEAMNTIVESFEESKTRDNILQLLDAGISSETIASSIVLKMFAEGVFTPDIAEIIKPPLVSVITTMGAEAGIEDINVINEIPTDSIPEEDKMKLMSTLQPEKFNRKAQEADQEMSEQKLASMIDFSGEENEEMMEAPVNDEGSFIDMEAE